MSDAPGENNDLRIDGLGQQHGALEHVGVAAGRPRARFPCDPALGVTLAARIAELLGSEARPRARSASSG